MNLFQQIILWAALPLLISLIITAIGTLWAVSEARHEGNEPSVKY
jgi:hypothetical protein